MPNVNPNESEKDFVNRCIPVVMKEGTAKDNIQAVAMCHSMYRQHNEKAKESKGTWKYNIHETLSLAEGQTLPDEGEGDQKKKSYKAWWPLLKVGPGNKAAKNYYSQKAVESAAPLAVARKKMFFGHIDGDVKPAERSVKDWAASVHETKIENGTLFGLIQAYDPWLKDRMYDAPGELACSIEGRGKPSGTIDYEGEKWNLIESVKWINAFNIVDYPGNSPMGITLTESDNDSSEEETYMNIAELKEKSPELYTELEKEIKEAAKAESDKVVAEKDKALGEKDSEIKRLKESQTADAKKEQDLKESLTKSENRLDALEALGKKKDRDAKVAQEMSKLPKEAITDKFKELVEKASDEKAALDLIDERAKLFEGKVIGHGKSDLVDKDKAMKEREDIFAGALGIKKEQKKDDKK